MKPGNTVRILIADRSPIVREGLKAVFSRHEDLQVLAEAPNAAAAIESFRTVQPDVLILEPKMPDWDGREVITRIRAEFERACVLVLSTSEGEDDIHGALHAGAQGYLFKRATGDEIVKAIRRVSAGHKSIEGEVASKLARRLQSPALSQRELEVLQLIVQGKSNQEIGRVLSIAEGTVKAYVYRILQKMDVGDRTQAMLAAIRRGLVCLPGSSKSVQ